MKPGMHTKLSWNAFHGNYVMHAFHNNSNFSTLHSTRYTPKTLFCSLKNHGEQVASRHANKTNFYAHIVVFLQAPSPTAKS